MKVNNTNLTNTNTSKVQLTPVSSSVSYLGTSVSYGITNNSSINAFNNTNTVSGNMGTMGTMDNTQFINPFTTTSNVYPIISASNYNQPVSGMYEYGTQFNQFGQLTHTNTRLVQPSVDISETSSDIMISAYVSNSVLNDLSLNVSEDSVTISGSVWTGVETCTLRRTIPLTTSVRAEAVDASLQSGVLEIRLPKTEKLNRTKTTIKKDVNDIK